MIPLLIVAVVAASAFFFRRTAKIAPLHPTELARHRLASDKERRESIFPFEL